VFSGVHRGVPASASARKGAEKARRAVRARAMKAWGGVDTEIKFVDSLSPQKGRERRSTYGIAEEPL